ncbi:MAG: hypothetical protein MUD16_03040 [Desulfobacterales bacterium]|jgi:hypothetical protein|nr:hypothetical protein [Desulfobacterales bacterium]
MQASVKRILCNEDGFVLGASILLSAILLLAGVLALWTSTNEMHVVRNEQDLAREFYSAEGGIVEALQNYDTGRTEWLTDAFLLAGPQAAFHKVELKDVNNAPVANLEVRCIMNASTPALLNDELSPAANTLPRQPHIAPPPSGSGFSLKYFEVRRYGITATSATGNTQVQIGAYKVFNKY